MPEAGLSLGSNLGDKAGAIETALAELAARENVRILRRSRLYRTEPWGDTDQDWFLNACALVDTGLSARDLLALCLEIEAMLGRDRARSRRWGPRPIDIDLLFYDQLAMNEPSLTLPHPHLFERAFVLVPLAEIAPDTRIGGRRVEDAARAVGSSDVSLWEGRV